MQVDSKTVPGGLVIVFEGLDGVGKTTQLDLTKQALEAAGWLVYSGRSHGGTPIGEQLRSVSHSDTPRPPLTDLYISFAMHAALAEELASQRLQGAICLIDRGALSNAAYQLYGGGLLDSLGWGVIDSEIYVYNSELTPLYQAPVAVALARAQSKTGGNADYFGSKPANYFEKVNRGYQDAARRYELPLIDANRSAELVQVDTMQAVQAAIEAKLKTI